MKHKLSMTDTEELAKRIRRHTLKMTSFGGSSHIGSILSIADIISVLFSGLKIDPQNPTSPTRDRFILSKGHAGAAVYAVLAEMGFFSTNMLSEHYQNGSKLSGHVSHKGIPGVEFSTGSLGHGLPVATGMALAAKRKNLEYKVYVLLSDGELDEGSNWEAILFAPHHHLGNLTAIIDYNKLQSLRSTEETLALEPIRSKFESFGWSVIEVEGHNHEQINEALQRRTEDRPKMIIAHTVKGRGVSFMENEVLWHYRSADERELDNALTEIGD